MADDPNNPFDIDRILYDRLGQVTVHWTQVEMILGEFLSFLVQGNPGLLYVITQNVAGSTITDWCRVLCEMRIEPDGWRKELKELFVELDDARKQRNVYIHGLWKKGPEPATALVRTVRWERREVLKDELVTVGDLESLLERTNELFATLLQVGLRMGFRKAK